MGMLTLTASSSFFPVTIFSFLSQGPRRISSSQVISAHPKHRIQSKVTDTPYPISGQRRSQTPAGCGLLSASSIKATFFPSAFLLCEKLLTLISISELIIPSLYVDVTGPMTCCCLWQFMSFLKNYGGKELIEFYPIISQMSYMSISLSPLSLFPSFPPLIT